MAIIYGRADSEKQLLDLYPDHVREIGDIEKVEAEVQERLKVESKGFFERFQRWRMRRQYKKFEANRNSLFHAGAKGENDVIKKLSELSDMYHVLCGVRIELPHFISYNGKKNLRSAQVDFVVISKKGVYAIEVKNWSDHYVDQRDYFSPHEQAGRAGRLLWYILKTWRDAPRVTSMVLSIKGNIEYDPRYSTVWVANINNINRFLEKQGDVLSDKEVERIVRKLKNRVTE